MTERDQAESGFRGWLRRHPLLRSLGPGLITGAADNDPSGVATYSQAGAQFGLNMLWTMPVAYPLMSAIQVICARIGRVTGRGLAANIRAEFPVSVVRVLVALLLVANMLNIAADLAAMGEVCELVGGLNRHAMTAVFALVSTGLQIFVPYHRYVRYLKWLTLSLFAYVAVVFIVEVPWLEVLRRTVWPHLAWNGDTGAVVLGVFGTTISPYLFFWQASEEVEDMGRGVEKSAPLRDDPAAAPAEISRMRTDTWTGMAFSDVTAFFIMLATGVTLHVSGVTQIDTAAQAASALKPVAGEFAYLLFAVGLIGVGLIGVPVLAGSGAYALAETMRWREGLEHKAAQAPRFYGVIAFSTLAGLGIQYLPISPMRALFWSAVINGIVAVPLMVVIIVLSGRKHVMGDFVAPPVIRALAWIGTAIMAVAALALL